MRKSSSLFALTSTFLFVFSSFAGADSLQQKADVTIAPDFSGSGVWTLPVSIADNGVFEFSDFKDYGSTGLMQYITKAVSDDNGDSSTALPGYPVTLTFKPKAGETILDTSSLHQLFVSMNIKSGLTQPAPLYEMWIAGGQYFFSPTLSVHFPQGWQLITSWPAGTVKDQTVTINYPADTPYVSPALLLFLPSTLPAGQAVVHDGVYTIIGSTENVQKIKAAVDHMGFTDNLYRKSLGLDPLSSVVVYVADLSKVKIGNEAEALAAKPNLVLYNKDIIASQTTQQIETTLVHEMTHLLEFKQQLFRGSTYIAPWFEEGLAVFMQNQARPYIYTNPLDQSVDDLLGETHVFTAGELQARESLDFDYLFQGVIASPVWDSYTLSGAVMSNFFQKAGASGIQKLFTALKDSNSGQLSSDHDSDVIISSMTGISGLTRDQLLSPYKSSLQFDTDAAFLIHPKADQVTEDAVVSFVKNKIHKYFTDSGIFSPGANPSTSAVVPPIVLPSTAQSTSTISASSSCIKITTSIVKGASNSDVKALQVFLIAQGDLAPGLTSGYYGLLTIKGMQLWQSAHGISPTGTVGPKTRAALAVGC